MNDRIPLQGSLFGSEDSFPEKQYLLAVEEEDIDSETKITRPWDPKLIRITTKNFSIREVFIQIEEDELDLSPDFQRSFVWGPKQQIRLIESILLGIPLPAFYFNQDSNGSHQVIDGVQRLTTIHLFMSGKLKLAAYHLEYLKSLEDMTFDELDPATKRRFASSQLVAHVIEPQTPDEVKYDIFSRVNTGGIPLSAQEIRHCMSKKRSRDFLQHLVLLKSFDQATRYTFYKLDNGLPTRDNQRMADRELALRFCAFQPQFANEYSGASSLDAFLLDFTRALDHSDTNPNLLPYLGNLFDQAMQNSYAIMGEYAFRRCPIDSPRRGPLNRAIFESQAIALAPYSLSKLQPVAQTIQYKFRELFDDATYDNSVRVGTGSPSKVERRLTATRAIVESLLR